MTKDTKTNERSNEQQNTGHSQPQRKKPRAKEVTKNNLSRRGSVWWIRVMVNGRRIWKAVGKNKMEAEAVLAEIKKQRARAHITGDFSGLREFFKAPDRRLFSDMTAQYMQERPHLKATTKRGYEEIFRNYLNPFFGAMYVDDITEEQIARFQSEIASKVSATRVNNIMGPLRYVLKVCHRRGLTTRNAALNVQPLREEEPDIDPLTAEELDKVFSVLPPYQRQLFQCLAWTGARPDEMFALRWTDVDTHRNEIHIRKGRVRGVESTTKTKAGNRVIYMPSLVKEILVQLKRNCTQHVDGYVFLNKHGQPYSRHIDREWRIALLKAGVRHRPSYQLRHTFASLALSNGAQPTWVAKMLGHTSPSITFKHYARYIDDASKANERVLEDFLSGLQNKSKRNQSATS